MANAPKHTSDEYQPCKLRRGDHMTREEFHRAYKQMPPNYKAELIAGTVHEPSPLSLTHGENHAALAAILVAYAASTPGTQVADNATVFLSAEDEVQPDLILRISPKYGGQSQTTEDDYISGPPELVAEIAHSSRAIDLHLKKERYARAGVLEYVVLCVRPQGLRWFGLRRNEEIVSDNAGIFRSAVFPGLWLNSGAILGLDYKTSMSTLNDGRNSYEYKDLLTKLENR